MSNYAERCNKKDDERRKEAGWCEAAWVGINYEPPQDSHEAWALKLVKELYPNGITIHVYDIVELLAAVRRANCQEKVDGRRSRADGRDGTEAGAQDPETPS